VPALRSDKLGLLIDTGGCPNRCAHCRVEGKPTRQMSYQEMRWIVQQFRELRTDDRPFFSEIDVSLWFMEPDFRDDYRTLWDLQCELSGVESKHGGLLSIWRIVSDDTYLPWVKERGGTLCQITLFGAGETHDRFTRPGAFADSIKAMKRLERADFVVQWLLIFTRAIIPDLDKLLRVAEDLGLPEQSEQHGGSWQPVLPAVVPVGRGWNLEHLRPSSADLDRLPELLRDRDRAGYGERTEAECTRLALDGKVSPGKYETLWLHVDASLNVFPQFGQVQPWYCLGNLRSDGPERIIEAYISDQTPGQHARFVIGAKALAEQYEDPNSDLLYTPGSLFHRWITQHCTSQGPREWQISYVQP
jgi:MoaA/NifB/PqqE/SkfB family radical SAM enzyme